MAHHFGGHVERLTFFILTYMLMTFSALAQDGLVTRHLSLCEGHADCRINIIEQKNKTLGGSCKGKLMDQFDCEVTYNQTADESKLKVTCLNKDGKTVIDQGLTPETITYKAAAIIRGFTGEETFIVDTNEYTFFNHSSFILFLTRSEKDVKGDIVLIMNETEYPFTDVSCL
jgi:hypothetical protein